MRIGNFLNFRNFPPVMKSKLKMLSNLGFWVLGSSFFELQCYDWIQMKAITHGQCLEPTERFKMPRDYFWNLLKSM